MLKVNEIFFSIQGESSLMGLPCVFVRLTKCDLRCSYCDTTYAYDEGHFLSLQSIITKIESYHCKHVLITGGEPLLQKEVYTLMTKLSDLGYLVSLETSGHILLDEVDPRVKKIMDVKTPSSLMSRRNNFQNFDLLNTQDEVKFVIGTEDDYNWSKKVVYDNQLDEKITVLFSPTFNKIKPATLASWILRDRLNIRFQLQLHKFIWDPEARGV